MSEVTFKDPVAVPHRYRNRFLRDTGVGGVVVGGGSSSSGGSVDLTPYLKKTDAEEKYLKGPLAIEAGLTFDDFFEKEVVDEETGEWVIKAKQTLYSVGGLSAYGYGGSSEPSGSIVTWSQIIKTGTCIAQITIDGVTTSVYAPNGGGGGTVNSWSDITDRPSWLDDYLGDNIPQVSLFNNDAEYVTEDDCEVTAGVSGNTLYVYQDGIGNSQELFTASTGLKWNGRNLMTDEYVMRDYGNLTSHTIDSNTGFNVMMYADVNLSEIGQYGSLMSIVNWSHVNDAPGSSQAWYWQVAYDTAGVMHTRYVTNSETEGGGVWSAWRTVIDSSSIGSQNVEHANTCNNFLTAKTIALTGNVTGSASGGGTNGEGWSIATTITDGAVTNEKLANDSVTMWGQTCELGSSASGAMTGVTTVNTDIHFENSGKLGVGVAPSYVLDVNGSARITGNVGIGAKPNSGYYLLVGGLTHVQGEIHSGNNAKVYTAMNALNFYSTSDGGTTRDFELSGAWLRMNSTDNGGRAVVFNGKAEIWHSDDDEYTLEVKNADSSENQVAVKIGDAYLVYDSGNECLKCYNKAGKAISILTTGGMTCMA